MDMAHTVLPAPKSVRFHRTVFAAPIQAETEDVFASEPSILQRVKDVALQNRRRVYWIQRILSPGFNTHCHCREWEHLLERTAFRESLPIEQQEKGFPMPIRSVPLITESAN
jgi:hypothetical protein